MHTCLDPYLLESLLGIQRGADVKHRGIKLIVLTWPGPSVLSPQRYSITRLLVADRVQIPLLPSALASPIESSSWPESSTVSDLRSVDAPECRSDFLADERENARCRPRRELK